MSSDINPRIVFIETSGMPDTPDLCENEEFKLEGATQFLRSAAEYHTATESVHSTISGETNCSIEVVAPAEAPTDRLSEKSVNDVGDNENFEIDEDEAIAELKVLELKILPENDDCHLKSMRELAQSKTFSGVSRSPLQHLNFLIDQHGEGIKDLVDIFPTV